MKLNELKKYTKSIGDNQVINQMSQDKDENLNKYIGSLICDLIQNIPMEESLRNNAKNHINNMKEEELLKTYAYTSLIPYLQVKLKDSSDFHMIISSYIEGLISYVIGFIGNEEFDMMIKNMNNTLGLSSEFYDKFLIYLRGQNQFILKLINNTL